MRSASAKFFAARAALRASMAAQDFGFADIGACARSRPDRREKPSSASPPAEFFRRRLMQLGNRLRRVHVVAEGGDERVADFGVAPFGRVVPAFEHGPAFLQASDRPVHRLAVMAAQHVEAQHLARPILQQIVHGHEIAEALRHFRAFDLEMAVVHPVARERMIVMRAFGLRDLVFVMREDEIDAAAMNVEGLAQIFARHGRAFQMPARAAEAPGAFPARRLVRPTASTARNPSGFSCRAPTSMRAPAIMSSTERRASLP